MLSWHNHVLTKIQTMVRRFTIFFKVGILAGLIIACEPSEDLTDINPLSEFNLLNELSNNERDSFEVSAAYLMVNEFRFEGERVERKDVKIELKDDKGIQVDLISRMFPSELTFSIPSGPYKEIKLRIESDANSKTPSLVIGGVLSDSLKQPIPVRFEFNEDLKFRLEIKQENDPFFLNDDLLEFFEVHDDLMESFHDIDPGLWREAERNSEGIILINAHSNSSLFQEIAPKISMEVRIEIDN